MPQTYLSTATPFLARTNTGTHVNKLTYMLHMPEAVKQMSFNVDDVVVLRVTLCHIHYLLFCFGIFVWLVFFWLVFLFVCLTVCFKFSLAFNAEPSVTGLTLRLL